MDQNNEGDKKMKDDIIRVGDEIKIIHPYVFIRCGYNLTKQSVEKEVFDKYAGKIEHFIESFKFQLSYRASQKFLYDLQDAIQHAYLHHNGFGGNKRKVFTGYEPDLKNKTHTVSKLKYVKTGRYMSYEYSYLIHEKVVKLIGIDITPSEDYTFIKYHYFTEDIFGSKSAPYMLTEKEYRIYLISNFVEKVL